MQYEITKEELLNLAAQKLADDFSHVDVESLVNKMIKERVDEAFKNRLNKAIDDFLQSELDKLVDTKITAVDIWGNPIGKPTTIRESLVAKSKDYWDQKVNGEGKPTTYGGETRATWIINKIVAKEFEDAVKANISGIIQGFKESLRADATKKLDEYIKTLIK